MTGLGHLAILTICGIRSEFARYDLNWTGMALPGRAARTCGHVAVDGLG